MENGLQLINFNQKQNILSLLKSQLVDLKGQLQLDQNTVNNLIILYSLATEMPSLTKNVSISVIFAFLKLYQKQVATPIADNISSFKTKFDQFIKERVNGDENYSCNHQYHQDLNGDCYYIDMQKGQTVPFADMTLQQLFDYRYSFLDERKNSLLKLNTGTISSSMTNFDPPKSWGIVMTLMMAAARGFLHHDVSLNVVRFLTDLEYPLIPRSTLVQKLPLPQPNDYFDQSSVISFNSDLQSIDLSGISSIKRLEWTSPHKGISDDYLQYRRELHMQKKKKLRTIQKTRFNPNASKEGHQTHIGGEWICHSSVLKKRKQRMIELFGNILVQASDNFTKQLDNAVLQYRQHLHSKQSFFNRIFAKASNKIWTYDEFMLWVQLYDNEQGQVTSPSYFTNALVKTGLNLIQSSQSILLPWQKDLVKSWKQLKYAQQKFLSTTNSIHLENFKSTEYSDEKVALYIHGGGYCIMSAATHRPLTYKISRETGCRVLAIDYRRTPEFAYPAALVDVTSSYLHLIDGSSDDSSFSNFNEMFQLDAFFPHPKIVSGAAPYIINSQSGIGIKKIKPENITIMGDSAGGGLTLSLLIHLRNLGLPLPASSVLISPWMELTCSMPSWDRNHKYDYIPRLHLMDTENIMSHFVGYVNQNDHEQFENQRKSGESLLSCESGLVSPLYGDIGNGLGRILLQCGEKEYLIDEALLFSHKISASISSGQEIPNCTKQFQLEVYQDMIHVWHFFEHMPQSQLAFQRIGQFVQNCFDIEKGRTLDVIHTDSKFNTMVESSFESTLLNQDDVNTPIAKIKNYYIHTDGTVSEIDGNLKLGQQFKFKSSKVSMQ